MIVLRSRHLDAALHNCPPLSLLTFFFLAVLPIPHRRPYALKDVFADLSKARGLIGGFGLAVSALVGTAYLMFLRIPGVLFLLIWGLLFGVLALVAGSGVVLYQTSESWAAEEEPRSHDSGQIAAAEYLSYVMFGEFWDMIAFRLLY